MANYITSIKDILIELFMYLFLINPLAKRKYGNTIAESCQFLNKGGISI